jgi:tRNA-specific 2-thiouridylase
MARDFGLPVAERAESQDLCFIADGDYRRFLKEHQPQVLQPGPIVDRRGHPLGDHQGLAFYTIGQRKGLGISSPEPLYVLEKRAGDNTLVVGPSAELGQQRLLAGVANWVSGRAPREPFRAQVKVRYKASFADGLVVPVDDRRFRVEFDQPVRDITPGQGAVVYQGEVCLGGGIIQSTPAVS